MRKFVLMFLAGLTAGLFVYHSSLAQTDTASLREKVIAMANIGSCRAGQYLPGGKEIVFISNLSGSPQVWKIPSAGGWPVQLTAFTDPVTTMAVAPRGNKIAYVTAPGGGLNSQVYLMNLDGSGSKMVTKGGKSNNFLESWSQDGSYLSYSSSEQNPSGMDFFIHDTRTGKSTLAVKNKGLGGIVSFSPDNRTLLLSRLAGRGSNDLYLFNRETNSEQILTKHDGPGTFFGQISPDGKVYMGSNKDRDLIAFGSFEGENIRILAERKNAELANLVINHAGTAALLVWNEGGKSKLDLFDLKTKKVVKQLNLPVELVASIDFSPNDESFVFTGSGSREPANLWVYNLASGAFQKITDSPHPGINLESLVAPTLVSFPSFDGLQISGWLYKPAIGAAPYPTVISYHGGPESQSIPGFNATAQALLANGIAFFLPNVRGSSGFGKKFVNLDNGALRVNGVKDIKAVSDYLVNSGIAKKEALGITGGSYGGYMVMAGVTEYPGMFAAGANLFGMVNFETFFKHTEPWMAAISTTEYGDPATQLALLQQLSPIHKINVIKTPLLVEHGANDTNVPVVEAEQVVEALKKNNVPVKYTLFPDEGHGWQKTKNRITSTVEIVEWFTERLK